MSDSAYVILSGKVNVILENAELTLKTPRSRADSMVGEMGVLSGSARFACVKVVTPLALMRINKDCFLRIVQDNAQFSICRAGTGAAGDAARRAGRGRDDAYDEVRQLNVLTGRPQADGP